MNPVDRTFQELRELIDLSLEGAISPEQMARLESLLLEGSRNRRYYCEYLNLSVGMERFYSQSSIPAMWEQGTLYPDLFWRELAKEELNAPAVEIQKAVPAQDPAPGAGYPNHIRRANKAALTLALVSLAAMVMMIAYIQSIPRRTSTAVVSEVLNASWAYTEDKVQPGDWLYNTDAPRFLESGIIQLNFITGTKATIEGPAEFTVLTDDQVKMRIGRIYATVPPGATGFTVRTPNAKVIDLGTEFGVKAEMDGSTEVHVFRGKTMLMAGGDGQESRTETVTSGLARAVTADDAQIHKIAIREDVFARTVDSKTRQALRGHRLSLADLVGGGNGFGTGRPDCGIVPDSGDFLEGPQYANGHGNKKIKVASAYFPVPRIPAIDGVFIPDGGAGQVVISSQGHVFSGCPDTSGSRSAPIINGAKTSFSSQENLAANDQYYGTPENPALFLHANSGITYNLEAIRKSLPDQLSPDRFVCQAASPMNPYGYMDSRFDLWVLVDGELRFSKTGVTINGSFPVDVDLDSQARFLTIVVTDGPDDPARGVVPRNHCDWCLLGRPELILEMN